MSNDPTSGNRWEPSAPPASRATPAPAATGGTPLDIDAPIPPATHDPAPYAVPPADLSGTANGGLRNRALRRRGLVGAVAALLFVGGGAGGYALAATTTDHGDTGTRQGPGSGIAPDGHRVAPNGAPDGFDPGHDDQQGSAG